MICPGCLKGMGAVKSVSGSYHYCQDCRIGYRSSFPNDLWVWSKNGKDYDSYSPDEFKELYPNLERLMKLESFE